jgi:hypothetical protein
MAAVPADTPVTVPVKEPTVATEGVLLTQLPPLERPTKEAVSAVHRVDTPPTEDGSGLTVTKRLKKQPVGKV